MEISSIAASRTWRGGVVIDDDVRPDEVAEEIRDPDNLVWIDLLAPDPGELAALIRELGLPPTAVEDALAPFERPKVSRHEGYLFFTVYATRLRPHDHLDPTKGRVVSSRISGIVTSHALVTIRLDDDFDMSAVERVWRDDPDLLAYGAGALVHGLLDVVVDGHFGTIQALDDETERLEDMLFAEGQLRADFVRFVYGLRKDLVDLRRIVLPMREVVNGVLRHRTDTPGELDSWYDDLYDHVLRAAEWTESLRDMVSTMFETHLSLQDSRLNQIMKKLAGWAAIIAVPTAITGWFGQNVPYWGFDQPWGVGLSIGMILVSSLGLYVLFRINDWV
ncbi:magnesium transporter CorA family protein [Raineyella sp.]|uniref:Cobalt/magnesium transport protein CorA n=1 Tax=bioreactor metagenome TaxID=1076179 RepID=A0A645D6H0_9ZZZZ|nr:magnesium transporter CorA family protein [Raineyella sp.]MEA5154750.1 magnesium transporter CorA family protein [Raineyella sp.]